MCTYNQGNMTKHLQLTEIVDYKLGNLSIQEYYFYFLNL